MSKFELKSDYAPKGDQPAAIAQLLDGLKAGTKEQTLLGVTGSGKSVIGRTKVFVEHGNKTLYLPIGELDGIFTDRLPFSEATQVVQFHEQLNTLALQPKTGDSSFESVTELSRHRYRGDAYTVNLACGRSNTFTDDHNVYVMRSGELTLLPSRDLKQGDLLPIPATLPTTKGGVTHLDVTEWLSEDGWYIESPHAAEFSLVAEGPQKAWRVTHKGERVALLDYRKATSTKVYDASNDRVGSVKRRATIPARVLASRELWRFLGLYIAEGHASDRYIVLSTSDDSIVREFEAGAATFGLSVTKRQKLYDYQVVGKTIVTLMEQWCGGRAQTKHLPVFWPQCSNEQLGALLGGIFAGDGWVEPHTVCLASVSRELLYDIQCALLRFGIHARVRHRTVKYNDGVRDSWVLAIYASDRERFMNGVGFGLARKDRALQCAVAQSRPTNTNVDLFQVPVDYIRSLMASFGILQRDIAAAAGVTRPLVSLYLKGERVPARYQARKILAMLLEHAEERGANSEVLRLEKLLALTDLCWSPISSITTETVETVVYDFSVPGAQTFFAGDGGYFVHNTFTMANLVQNLQRPTLVLSHNKTLAAQLYAEFKNFFPNNAVHYFVSYFDYYQPEAYIARSDTYIEKDSAINEEIDRLRHAATDALLTRKDVLIVASVSCIYGIGSVEDYDGLGIEVRKGERRVRDKFLRQLTDIQYQRNDMDFHRSTFRVRGDVVDVFPAGEELAYRIDFFGDDIDRITKIDPLTGEILATLDEYKIFPGSHYVTPQAKLKVALGEIEAELEDRLRQFRDQGKLLEAQRLEQRTRFDIEMLEQTGFVKGIENYSRYLTNRKPGEQPATLLDYFPDDYLLLADESHMTIPQVRGMYNGDRARKEVLVEYGFRLPSALDNRPLTFPEFERHVNQVVYVSATPAEYELSRSPKPAQQVIRPTGLLDPKIEVRPIEGQIDDLIAEIRITVEKRQRVLVTTLTKRMSEDLTEYLQELNIKVAYLHSDVDTLDRIDILRDLRLGVYDVLVGINLLREGLDLPEVSLVAILDADKEGFLRSEAALIQTVGRAARHVEGHVIMYADRITDSMRRTLDETERRRGIQEAYNKEHGITPKGINRAVEESMKSEQQLGEEAKRAKIDLKKIPKDEYGSLLKDLTAQMELAAANLQFEQAAELRDLIAQIKANE